MNIFLPWEWVKYAGPLMAKGVEGTSMYQYNCLIAHNEVGDALNAGGITIEEFHRLMISRGEKWLSTMNTTSTHDTKRGEDMRARLNVISVLADEWEQNVRNWMAMNQKLKERLSTGLLEPSTSVEYFLYQTLLGTFPFDGRADETYIQRIKDYMVKALREAKRKVSWRDPELALGCPIFTREPSFGILHWLIPTTGNRLIMKSGRRNLKAF